MAERVQLNQLNKNYNFSIQVTNFSFEPANQKFVSTLAGTRGRAKDPNNATSTLYLMDYAFPSTANMIINKKT